MNLFTSLLIYVLNTRNEKNVILPRRVFLLENDFWPADKDDFKTEKGYLNRVFIDVKSKKDHTTGCNYYPETCYSLKFTNLGYIVPKFWVMDDKDVDSFLNSLEVDKFLFKFRFFFNGGTIGGNIQSHVTYKLAEKMSENTARLRHDGIDIRMEHINERFELFLTMRLLRFNEYIKILNEKKGEEIRKTENDAKFDLYYFENYSDCFESLKEFIKDLCYFNLLKDDFFYSCTAIFSKIPIDKSTTLKLSQFKKIICKTFYDNLKKLNYSEADKTWKPVFDQCCNYFANVILEKKVFLLIGGKYDIDYYIVQLSNFIYEATKELRIDYAKATPKNKNLILSKIADLLRFNLQNLQLMVLKNLFESEFIPKHFQKLLRKDVETLDDFIEVEKIVCDYYNMFIYTVSLYYEFIKKELYIPYSYYSPICIDKYNLRIIDGIKIEFNMPAKFKQIRGFDDKEVEVIMMRDVDFFIDESSTLYCPSNVLRMKNIQEIEIISFDEKNSMKFKVNEYLNIKYTNL